jgi:hypothetical protein
MMTNIYIYRGVDKFFQTLTRLASGRVFSLATSENNSGSGEENECERRKNTHQAGELVFVFTRRAKLEFNSHLASGYPHP